MRELKFRAWDPVLKFMMYGEDIESSENIHTGLSYGKLYVAYETPKRDWENLILMQYIGVQDKNHKDIYEGDILDRGHKSTPTLGVVEYWSASFRVNAKIDSGLYNLSLTGAMNDGKMEIIGNRYENPELLEAIHERN